MKTDKEIEKAFGLTKDQIEKLAAPWDEGEGVGKPVGKIMSGRPLKFGKDLTMVGFKETKDKIYSIDQRAKSLDMSRSDYLRWLVDRDLAETGVA